MGVVEGDIVKKKVEEVRRIAEDWMGGKAKDGGKDDQRGQLIKGTRNPEPWWEQRGSREQRKSIRCLSENP